MKSVWMMTTILASLLALDAAAASCNNKDVGASGVGGVAGATIGTVLLGPAGEVIGGAVGGAVGSVVANNGRANSGTMLGGAVGGASGAILGRGLGGGKLLAVLGAGLGSAGGACVAQQSSHRQMARSRQGRQHQASHSMDATRRAQSLLVKSS